LYSADSGIGREDRPELDELLYKLLFIRAKVYEDCTEEVPLLICRYRSKLLNKY